MSRTETGLLPAVLLAVALAGCARPPQAVPGRVLGYGTPGVESCLPPGEARTLAGLALGFRGTHA